MVFSVTLELQASQSHVLWHMVEPIVLETISIHIRQEVDCEQSAWIYKEKTCLANMTASCDDLTGPVDERREMLLVFISARPLLSHIISS